MWGAIILGGGSGQRMGAKCNKVLLPIAGKSMIVRSVEAFVPLVEQVVVVSREEDMPVMASELAQNGLDVPMVSGGATRQESVWRGLQALSGQCDGVLVHDGARCLVTADVIQRCMASVEECGTGVAAVPVTDTIKTVSDANIALDTPNRTSLRAVQTPQGFQLEALLSAHAHAVEAGLAVTDDASLLEALGLEVRVIQGEAANVKITRPEDLDLLQDENPLPSIRTGMGYDVHRYGQGRPMRLGGVSIPNAPEVLAHSDGDVLLHALSDALLGCACLGDIGQHFSDKDPRFDGISSAILLHQVLDMVREAGCTPCHVDMTIVAQVPKLAPYREEIRKNVARLMGLPASCVNLKATTEEHLGFTGRSEGIKAYAVVTARGR